MPPPPPRPQPCAGTSRVSEGLTVTPDRSPPTEDKGRIVRFRRRGAPGEWRWPKRNPPHGDPPGDDLTKFEQSGPEDDYRHRMTINALGFLVTILLVIAGVWMADKITEMRKNQDCVLSGRRNCAPIDVPPVQRY
jgi:hypothetical protein